MNCQRKTAVLEKVSNTRCLSISSRPLQRRLRLANAAAASFYFENIRSSASAGVARQHLIERGFTPQLIRQFCIGYAEDVYYRGGKMLLTLPLSSPSMQQQRQQKSLVEHLESLGFTPEEIVQAGLAAVVTKEQETLKSKKQRDDSAVRNNVTTVSTSEHSDGDTRSDEVEEQKLTYKDLKDRFRNRLVIPIWDNNGNHVVGFGGRILSLPDTGYSSTFTPPKYLNSPESIIFKKREILFGIHAAAQSLVSSKNEEGDDEESAEGVSNDDTTIFRVNKETKVLLIVEGYMDALALTNIGVKNVAASMGTSLSLDQLRLGANIVTTNRSSGKILLLMDQDKAGISAVERLCTSQILHQVTKSHNVEVLVALLPDGYKDPAEFVQGRRNGKISNDAVKAMFENEVVNAAQEWKEWYLNHIVCRYAEDIVGDHGSGTKLFVEVCELASEFISTFSVPAERTCLVQKFANRLADMITVREEEDKASAITRKGTLVIQLESDLFDMSNRKARAREALARRVEDADLLAGSDGKKIVSQLASGEGTAAPGYEDPINKLHRIPVFGSAKNNAELPLERLTDKVCQCFTDYMMFSLLDQCIILNY